MCVCVCVCVSTECIAVTTLTTLTLALVEPEFYMSDHHFAPIQKCRGTEIQVSPDSGSVTRLNKAT